MTENDPYDRAISSDPELNDEADLVVSGNEDLDDRQDQDREQLEVEEGINSYRAPMDRRTEDPIEAEEPMSVPTTGSEESDVLEEDPQPQEPPD